MRNNKVIERLLTETMGNDKHLDSNLIASYQLSDKSPCAINFPL